MRWRMAAKIAAMNMPPQRIAVVALVAVLLVGGAAWWWSNSLRAAQHTGHMGETSAAPRLDDAATSRRPQVKSRPGQAGVAEQCGSAMMAAMRTHAEMLRQRRDAQSQLGYALTSPLTVYWELAQAGRQDDPEALQRRVERQQIETRKAFARARGLAPENADIRWLAAIHCGVDEACNGLRRELLEAEPDNAAAWLREMTWARMRHDKAAVERAFRRASEASRYDRHAGASQLAILESFSAVAMPAMCEAENVQTELRRLFPGESDVGAVDFVLMTANSLAGMEVPAYADIRQHCLPGNASGLDVARRAACGKVLEKMAESDSMLDQSIALSLLVEIAGDGDDAIRWRERYRNLKWLFAHMGKPVFNVLTMEDYAFDEMGAMQRALEAKGLWPAPPDWLPTDDHARSLILSGRPPPEKKPNPAP